MNKEYEYRIYYETETGKIKGLAHENYPDWGEYIVVNKHEYENYFRYYVKNGKTDILKLVLELLCCLIKLCITAIPSFKSIGQFKHV